MMYQTPPKLQPSETLTAATNVVAVISVGGESSWEGGCRPLPILIILPVAQFCQVV
jgi:hypothetical protein